MSCKEKYRSLNVKPDTYDALKLIIDATGQPMWLLIKNMLRLHLDAYHPRSEEDKFLNYMRAKQTYLGNKTMKEKVVEMKKKEIERLLSRPDSGFSKDEIERFKNYVTVEA